MLRVMAEVSCAPVPQCHPRQAFPAAPILVGTDPLPQGQTHFCRRDAAVLPLHGEALGREKKGT